MIFPVPSTPPGWLSISEMADYFGISRQTVHRLIKTGEWPSPQRLPGLRQRKFSPAQRAEIEQRAAA